MGVAVVCRERPQVWAIPHVVDRISAFIDTTGDWDVFSACEAGYSLRAVRRIRQRKRHEQPQDRFVVDRQFNRAVDACAARGDLETIKFLATEYVPSNLITEGAVHAARNGHLRVVRWLLEEYRLALLGMEVVDAVAWNGHFEIVKCLAENPPPREFRLNRTSDEEWEAVVRASVLRRPVNITFLQWAVEHGYLQRAVENGHLDAVKWFAEYLDRKFHGIPDHCSDKAESVGQWSACFPYRLDLDRAESKEASECILWLHAQHYSWLEMTATIEAMDGAASCGNIEFVMWLHENRTEGCTERAMDGTACCDDLELVKWLHKNRLEGCMTNAMDGAVRSGHLKALQFLFENRNEERSRGIINGAVQSRYLEVVQWMTENCASHPMAQCTTDAMDNAAKEGHVKMVKWLHQNRSEGCTTRAMDGAALNRHFEVILFLHAYRSEGCSFEAFKCAFRYGKLEMLRWLAYNYPYLYDRDELLKWETVTNKRLVRKWVQDGGFLVRGVGVDA